MFSGIKLLDKSIATKEVLSADKTTYSGWLIWHCHPWAGGAKQLINEILSYTRKTVTS